jgi:hypothetical protein
MAQTGNTRGGKVELEAGLKGLAAWLESLPGTGEMGQFWDPEHRIANGISQLLKQVQVERPDWQSIATNVEWLGMALEEEIENVNDDFRNSLLAGGGDGS